MAFTEETVLVLGAGASAHYGYPIGTRLIDKISKAIKISENRITYERFGFIDDKSLGVFQSCGERIGATYESWLTHTNLDHFQESLDFYDPLSIDAFLSQQSRNFEYFKDIGKYLIAYTILKSENAEVFAKSNNTNWYRIFFNALIAGKTPEELLDQPLPLTIVTFNYDVSLEYYLLSRIRGGGFFSEQEAEKFSRKVFDKIIHVYGSVRKIDPEQEEVTYGFNTRSEELFLSEKMQEAFVAKDRLKIINEDRLIDSEIHQIMNNAKRIFILGFAFDEDNMKVLLPQNFSSNLVKPELYYTNYIDGKEVSGIVDSRVTKYFTLPSSPAMIKRSSKNVYNALMYDFSLT